MQASPSSSTGKGHDQTHAGQSEAPVHGQAQERRPASDMAVLSSASALQDAASDDGDDHIIGGAHGCALFKEGLCLTCFSAVTQPSCLQRRRWLLVCHPPTRQGQHYTKWHAPQHHIKRTILAAQDAGTAIHLNSHS